jgi:hypothetical protein
MSEQMVLLETTCLNISPLSGDMSNLQEAAAVVHRGKIVVHQ